MTLFIKRDPRFRLSVSNCAVKGSFIVSHKILLTYRHCDNLVLDSSMKGNIKYLSTRTLESLLNIHLRTKVLQAYEQQSVSNLSPNLFLNFPLTAQTGNITASAQTFPPASGVTEFLSVTGVRRVV